MTKKDFSSPAVVVAWPRYRSASRLSLHLVPLLAALFSCGPDGSHSLDDHLDDVAEDHALVSADNDDRPRPQGSCKSAGGPAQPHDQPGEDDTGRDPREADKRQDISTEPVQSAGSSHPKDSPGEKDGKPCGPGDAVDVDFLPPRQLQRSHLASLPADQQSPFYLQKYPENVPEPARRRFGLWDIRYPWHEPEDEVDRRKCVQTHPQIQADDLQGANRILKMMNPFFCRQTDGVGARGSFYEFVCRDFVEGNTSVQLGKLANILEVINDQKDPNWRRVFLFRSPAADWLGRCLTQDGAPGREEFLQALNLAVEDAQTAAEKLKMWALAANYVNGFGEQDAKDKLDPAFWQARVDVAEIARVLLTFDVARIGRAARLYVHALGPNLPDDTDHHANLVTALRELPLDLWFAEDSGTETFFRHFLGAWWPGEADSRRLTLASYHAATRGLADEDMGLVLRAMERIATDARRLSRIAFAPTTDLQRAMQIVEDIPRCFVVDFAKYVLSDRQAFTVEQVEARAQAFVYELETRAVTEGSSSRDGRRQAAVSGKPLLLVLPSTEAAERPPWADFFRGDSRFMRHLTPDEEMDLDMRDAVRRQMEHRGSSLRFR